MKDRIKTGTLVKLLAWLAILALILASGRLALLWVFLIISALVLVAGAMTNDEKAHRNGQRKGHLGVYGNQTNGPGSINLFRRFGYPATGLPTDELHKDLINKEEQIRSRQNMAD